MPAGGRVQSHDSRRATEPSGALQLQPGADTHYAGAICVVPALGLAPTNVPARQGNTWGGFNHEPVPNLSIAKGTRVRSRLTNLGV